MVLAPCLVYSLETWKHKEKLFCRLENIPSISKAKQLKIENQQRFACIDTNISKPVNERWSICACNSTNIVLQVNA